MWFRKRQPENQQGAIPYEEISEKRTTKIGYVLLIIMAAFIIWIGQTVFDDLSNIPDAPRQVSSCASKLSALLKESRPSYDYESYGYSGGALEKRECVWSEYDEQSGVKQMITSVYPKLSEYYTNQRRLSVIERSVIDAEQKRSRSGSDYDLSLQERQAAVPGVIDQERAQTDVLSAQQQLTTLADEKAALVMKQNGILSDLRATLPGYADAYDQDQHLYETAYNWYRFRIFLLMLLFVAPFFALSLRKYLVYKKTNSPYTIIAGAVLAAMSVLSLQVVGVFLYEIIPRRLLKLLLDFFAEVAALRYVLYYGSVLLVIGLFGGIVYYIQKKIFNRTAVALRHLKDRKCPVCAFSIDMSMKYCPKCAHQLRAECVACHESRLKDLPVCEHCGTKG
ncbi:MAG: hypothetical protein KBD65_02060 [Candidatus Moranbacteria bacterium]|nr:hypothetical protein [Candidatus Moranbacteria bacterium]